MKTIILLLFTTLSYSILAQTGSLICRVNLNAAKQCKTTNIYLTSRTDTLNYRRVRHNDTLTDIPVGYYKIHASSCDSTTYYAQNIEVVENEIRVYIFNSNSLIGDQDDPYFYDPYSNSYPYNYGYEDTSYQYMPIYVVNGFQFGRGLKIGNDESTIINNLSFDYTAGQDFLVTKPIAIGYEAGLGYSQINYSATDFQDSSIVYEKQKVSSLNLSFGAVASLYIKGNRFLAIGARYRFPIYARWSRVTGNDYFITRGVSNYNDLSVFAHLGYYWGFVFAEYRLDPVLKSPLENPSQLTLGVRLNVPFEW